MSAPAEQIESARTVDILTTAQRFVDIKRVSRSSPEYFGPCPVCGGTDRFSINVRKQVFNCRGCGAKGDVIALAQHARGVPFAEAVAGLAGEAQAAARAPTRPRAADPDDAHRNSRAALRIWDGARSIRGTLAETYLVRVRGVDVDQILDIDGVLRFVNLCPFGGGDRQPCLIALVRHVLTDEPKAIQRTALGPDGSKIDRRSLGPTKGGAIKLWSDAEVTQGLVVGEGLETTAAAATRIEHHGTLLQPAWALIDRTNLRDLPVLAAVEALTILVDHDVSGDGQAAASVCASRWLDAGREVIRLRPKAAGSDFNDVVREGAS